jgi:uncharacterized Zn-finger protein
VKPFTCSWEGCGKTFQRKDNMSQHYKTHADREGKASKSSRRPTVDRVRSSQKRSKPSTTAMLSPSLPTSDADANFSHSSVPSSFSPSSTPYYHNCTSNRLHIPRTDSIGGIGGGLETLAIVANQLQRP